MTGPARRQLDPLVKLDLDTMVARAQDGDLAAFEALVDQFSGPLFRLAYRMVGDRPTAEDIVQDALLTAWRRLPVLAEPGAFGGWLYQVATNRCLDLLRQQARQRTEATDAGQLERVADQDLHRATDPADAAEVNAQLDELAALLRELPGVVRACWVLRELQGLSYLEIATIVHSPESTVRGRIARARCHLAKGMSRWQ